MKSPSNAKVVQREGHEAHAQPTARLSCFAPSRLHGPNPSDLAPEAIEAASLEDLEVEVASYEKERSAVPGGGNAGRQTGVLCGMDARGS